MRYQYEQATIPKPVFGETYICNHPVYNHCTLFTVGEVGLAVIQQRYDPKTKYTWWGEIDTALTGELYLHSGFHKYFKERARKPELGIYPTVTIRQIMWALRMKPLPKQRWETVFDHRNI